MINDEKSPELEQDVNENQDVEETEETSDETTKQSNESDDKKDWKAEALKYKAILDRNKSKPEQKSFKKSNEFGYAEKAFLTASGLKGSKEFELAQTFAKETGKNLEQVLESKYFQNELNDLREIERTTNATIKGKDSKGVSIDSVEYWATKDFKDVPKEMKSKVIEYNLKKETKGVFYNS